MLAYGKRAARGREERLVEDTGKARARKMRATCEGGQQHYSDTARNTLSVQGCGSFFACRSLLPACRRQAFLFFFSSRPPAKKSPQHAMPYGQNATPFDVFPARQEKKKISPSAKKRCIFCV